jgi:hypothetical protein
MLIETFKQTFGYSPLDFERTWWMLFMIHVKQTNLDTAILFYKRSENRKPRMDNPETQKTLIQDKEQWQTNEKTHHTKL